MKSKIFWVELVLIVAQVGKIEQGLYSIDNEMLSSLQDLITIGIYYICNIEPNPKLGVSN